MKLPPITFAGLVAVLATACGPSAEQLTRLRAELDHALERARALDAARAKGVEADLAAPTVTATRCDSTVVLTSTGSPPANPVGYLLASNPGNYREIEPDKLTTPATRVAWAEKLGQSVQSALDPKSDVAVDGDEAIAFRRRQIAEIGDPNAYRHDVELVVLERVLTRRISDAMFTPGSRRARIVVWDYAQSRVACHADVSVASKHTETVDGDESGNQGLESALDVRLREVALAAIGL